MTVTLPNGIDVRYAFRYFTLNDPRREITQCIIYNATTKENLALGETKLNPKDQPNRKIARKIAFQRAVTDLYIEPFGLNQSAARKSIWEHFLTHVRFQ